MTVTMAACVKNVSVVKKGALWDNTSTSRRALKVKIALYRGGRKDYKPVLAKRYVVCIVLNGESSFQDDAVMRKLKFGELPLAR